MAAAGERARVHDYPDTVSTVSATASPAPTVDVMITPADITVTTDLPGGWAEVDLDPEYTSPVVLRLARLLADAGVAPGVGGAEVEGGVVVDLAWPDARVAVVIEETPTEDIEELTAAGWSVHRAAEESDDLAYQVASSITAARGTDRSAT